MEKFFKAIEEKIRKSGYPGEVSGKEIYAEISDEAEDQEEGSYLFMKKQNDDIMFEYRVDILEDNINLATLTIHTSERTYLIDFDAE
jgi:Fe-S cluster biosynthesis and repair protein YggX